MLGDAEAVARLRGAGLESVRVGELELRFAPSVPPSTSATHAEDYDPDAPATERKPPTADDDERNALELLLHSSGGDAEPLLEMQRRATAAREPKAAA